MSRVFLILAALFFLAFVGIVTYVIIRPTPPAAKIADHQISQQAVDQLAIASGCHSSQDSCFLNAQRGALSQLIDNYWISSEAKRLKVTVASGELNRRYQTALATWRDAAGQKGLRPTFNSVRLEMLTDKLAERQSVSQEQISRALRGIEKSQPAADSSPITVRRNLQVVFTRRKDKIQVANAALKSGRSLAEVARRFSEQGNAEQGGYVDNVATDSLGRSAAFYFQAYPPGKTFGPVAVPGGWAIIRIISLSKDQDAVEQPQRYLDDLARLNAGKEILRQELISRYRPQTSCQKQFLLPQCSQIL